MDFNGLLSDINECVDMFELLEGDFVVVKPCKGVHIMQANAVKSKSPHLDYVSILICLTVQIDGCYPTMECLMNMWASDYMKILDAVSFHLNGGKI